jgi:hypothetical protein
MAVVNGPFWSWTMMLMSMTEELETYETQPVPAEVAMVMSALEAADHSMEEHRLINRVSYRTTTHLRLFRDESTTAGWLLYTRDINSRGLGFITPHRLPLGYGGVVVLPGDNGRVKRVHCMLSRCREAAPGWFEGCLHFNREQPHFDL